MTQLVAIKAGVVVAISGFVSRAVTATAGTELAIIIYIKRFRGDADVRRNCRAESHACSAVAIFYVGVVVLSSAKRKDVSKAFKAGDDGCVGKFRRCTFNDYEGYG